MGCYDLPAHYVCADSLCTCYSQEFVEVMNLTDVLEGIVQSQDFINSLGLYPLYNLRKFIPTIMIVLL